MSRLLAERKSAHAARRTLRTPTSYAQAQRMMFAAITRRLVNNGMQAAWTDGEDMARYAELFVKSNDRLTSFERLEIYNQQYWWRILESFADDFCGLRAVIGKAKFDALAVAYLETCGSTSWTLRNLGQHLETFIRSQPNLTAPHTALALDMARLEWARVWAFDEPGDPILDPQILARTSPECLRLALQPYVVLLELQYESDKLLLRFHRRRQSAAESTASNAVNAPARRRRFLRITAKLAKKPVHLIVHRHDSTLFYKRLAPEAFTLLTLLRKGDTLGAACASAFAGNAFTPEQAAETTRKWFTHWMALGWFASPSKTRRATLTAPGRRKR